MINHRLERVSRDLAVFGITPAHELGEVRLRSEEIQQTSCLTHSLEVHLRTARDDVHAVRYLNLCKFAYFSMAGGVSTGGTLNHLNHGAGEPAPRNSGVCVRRSCGPQVPAQYPQAAVRSSRLTPLCGRVFAASCQNIETSGKRHGWRFVKYRSVPARTVGAN